MIFLLIFFYANLYAKENFLEVISFNVQNLFDSSHDKGYEDFQYLPIKNPLKKPGCKSFSSSKRKSCQKFNWTEKNINQKIIQIEKIVGKPDILAVVEIENENVAKRLAKKLGFSKFILARTRDKRGIRTALFLKEGKVLREKEILVKNSRSILEAKIDYENFGTFTFFVNHWPSQGHSGVGRELAGKLLLNRINQLPKERLIVLGDFNLDPRLETNTFFESKKLIDLNENNMGTYFFIPEKKWLPFDRILISQNLKNKIKSFEVLKNKFVRFILGDKEELIPHPFNPSSLKPQFLGFSDHFPVRLFILPVDGKKF